MWVVGLQGIVEQSTPPLTSDPHFPQISLCVILSPSPTACSSVRVQLTLPALSENIAIVPLNIRQTKLAFLEQLLFFFCA